MKTIDRLTAIEKALPEGITLEDFYNIDIREERIRLQGRFSSTPAKALKYVAGLAITDIGYVEGEMMLEGEIKPVSITLT